MGGIVVKIAFYPFWKRSILKGENLLPSGANSFILELTDDQKEFGVQESKQEVIKVVTFVKIMENLPCVLSLLYFATWHWHCCCKNANNLEDLSYNLQTIIQKELYKTEMLPTLKELMVQRR